MGKILHAEFAEHTEKFILIYTLRALRETISLIKNDYSVLDIVG